MTPADRNTLYIVGGAIAVYAAFLFVRSLLQRAAAVPGEVVDSVGQALALVPDYTAQSAGAAGDAVSGDATATGKYLAESIAGAAGGDPFAGVEAAPDFATSMAQGGWSLATTELSLGIQFAENVWADTWGKL